MDVFISWSGPRSKALADALRAWLPRVLQASKPWMSDEDISAGSRWLSEVQSKLSETTFGVICVTPENQASPWLLFEAGALSKALAQTRVCPLLLGMSSSQLSGPLSQFQASVADQDGVTRIVSAINSALGTNGLAAEHLSEVIEVWWPRLEDAIAGATDVQHDHSERRSNEEILDELIANTREQLRRENIRLESSKARDNKLDEMLELMSSSFGALQQTQDRLRSVAGQIEGTPGEALQLLTQSPSLDVAHFQTMFGSIKEFSERLKKDQENILGGPKESEEDGGPAA